MVLQSRIARPDDATHHLQSHTCCTPAGLSRITFHSALLLPTQACDPASDMHCACRLCVRFAPQEISNLLYGYGQLHYTHPLLLEAVASTCAPRLPDFSAQDVCLTVWGYGAVGYTPMDTSLFEAACRVLLQRKERLVPLQIVMVVKGFSRAGYQPPAAFMQQMSQLAQAKLSQFSPLEYSQLLWGYSTAGYRDVQLFETVVAHAIHQLHTRTHLVTKTTCDTLLLACQGVGFWPQLLVDTAEMNGLYVKTTMQAESPMQPLVQSVPGAADPTPAAAAGTEATAVASGAADSGSSAPAAAASTASVPAGSSSVDVAGAISAAFGVGVEQQADGSGQQQQQQQEPQPQQRQVSRLDNFLQRPPPPRRPQQQQQQLPLQGAQPQQQQQQIRQQQDQQGLNHPLLRSQLLPPPALPRQQQQHNSLPAAAVGSLELSNGNHSSYSSQHSNEHSGSSSSSSQHNSGGTAAAAASSSTGLSDAVQLQQQQQGEADDVLLHPVQQL